MYGPAVCPRALVAGDIRSASLAGSTPICALYMSIPDERVRTSASAFATVARAATVAYKLNTNATKISTVSEPSPHMTKTILLVVGPDDDSSVGGSASINSSSLPNAGCEQPRESECEPADCSSAMLGIMESEQSAVWWHSLNHQDGVLDNGFRYRHAKGFSSFEIDTHIHTRRSLHWDVARLGPLENLVY